MTTATALRVEIGPAVSGKKLGEDWTTVGMQNVDHECFWGIDKLPFENDTVDELYACHVIEHIPWWSVQEAVDDAFRVIAPGGTIELHTIDFRKVVDHYIFGSVGDWGDRKDLGGTEPMLWVSSRLFSHGEKFSDIQWHRSLFDGPYLGRLLTNAGFVDIEPSVEPRGPEKHGVSNIGIKAVKP